MRLPMPSPQWANPMPSRNPPAGWVRLPVEMPREMRDALKHLAIDEGTSAGAIIREMIEARLRKAGR